MALEDSLKPGNFNLTNYPDPKPKGLPSGRFVESPLSQTKMGDTTYSKPADKLAREDGKGLLNFPIEPQQFQDQFPAVTKMATIIDGVTVQRPGAKHMKPSTTYGTFRTAKLSANDPFGDL